ncbi:hypothetical protein GCM10007416_28520 [Kroppenstedtia guangzhouensis]|uniref:Outer membrane lipoprotein-sorting protein n=1 Tax=Kroppenstedtia guangzhouensis TaxID=1274356 RepID=A0ABQ1H0E5_9BACL|nr:DUF6612 family protein [Kroppenstedtia guangzhouensis]GGA53676.1 hypothetical protein GCM10007416_28520 [Kroppenstedtia guangzhouensis]
MKSGFRMGIILLSFWLLTGCSLITSGFTAGDEGTSTGEKVMKKKEKTAAEILEESKQAMEKMAGYRWELSGEQRMDIPGESENGLTAFSGSVDYQESTRYAADFEVKIEFSNQRHHTMLKMIVDGETAYLQDKARGDWLRKEGSAEEIHSMMGLEKQYTDAVEVLEMVGARAKDLSMNQAEGVRRLTLRLENHDDIQPFMQYAVDNWREDDKVKAEEVTFSDLELILTIDDSTQRLTQIEKNVKVVLPFVDGVSTDLSQTFTSKMTGEVDEIMIPEEAKNAPLVDE